MASEDGDARPTVDWLEVPVAGRLGLMAAPRPVDLPRLLAVHRPKLWVTLLTAVEQARLQLGELQRVLQDHAACWCHLPVRDGDVPADDDRWLDAVQQCARSLEAGETALVHCRAGRGRTGMFAASVLCHFGVPVGSAIAAVRGVRTGAIETPAQGIYVADAAALLARATRRRGRDL